MTAESADDILIADIVKNGRETLRVQMREYRGHRFTDARTYFKADGTDEIRPTSKGITVKADQIEELIDALRQAKAVLDGAR